MVKELKNFTDNNGMIHHLDDGPNFGSRYGDSKQRTFMLAVKDRALNVFSIAQVEYWSRICTSHEGEPTRHWHGNYWPGQAGYLTRDNLFPEICALTLADSKRRWHLLWKIIKRGGFLWNTKKIGQPESDKSLKVPDWCGPLMWLISFKFIYLACLYLYLPIYFHLRTVKKNPSETSDDLNIQVALLTLDLLIPLNHAKGPRSSWVSVSNYYFINRLTVPGFEQRASMGYRQALVQYFDNELAPPLDVEWFKAIDARGWPGLPAKPEVAMINMESPL